MAKDQWKTNSKTTKVNLAMSIIALKRNGLKPKFKKVEIEDR